jgi:hemerythrin-like domain-containing protein
MSLSRPQRTDLRARLVREHSLLEERFADVARAFRANAREEVVPLWTSFERSLLEHMELEEELILPQLAKDDPEAAAQVEAEHKQICAQLTEMGVGVDLHRTRADAVESFIETLRAHARREDELTYRWAEKHLDEAPRRELLSRLRRRPPL